MLSLIFIIIMEVQFKQQGFGTVLGLCGVCKKKVNKYVCPKCSVPYCSLGCYKAHDTECTEGFYKDQVIQVLKNRKASKAQASEVSNMLKRTQDLPDAVLEEIKENSSEIRLNELQKIVENEANPLNFLTDLEKKEFFEFVNSGKVIKYLKEWEPWWIDTQNDWCIEVCSTEAYLEVPDIQKLCKKPSNFLIFHIFEAVWTVVYSWRMVNGEITENSDEIIKNLKEISQVLNGLRCEYTGFDSVYEVILQKITGNDLELAQCLLHPVNFDCLSLFSSKWRLIKLLIEFSEFTQNEKVSEGLCKEGKKWVLAVAKKIEFFISFLKSVNNGFVEAFKQDLEQYLIDTKFDIDKKMQ